MFKMPRKAPEKVFVDFDGNILAYYIVRQIGVPNTVLQEGLDNIWPLPIVKIVCVVQVSDVLFQNVKKVPKKPK